MFQGETHINDIDLTLGKALFLFVSETYRFKYVLWWRHDRICLF